MSMVRRSAVEKKGLCFQTSSYPLLTHKIIYDTANIA